MIKKSKKLTLDDQKIIQRYSDRLKKYGYNPKTLGWDSKKNQNERFKRCLANIKIKNPKILDIGCGFGDFYNFIINNNFLHKSYTGLDINNDILNIARKKFPKGKFINQNFINKNLKNKYDLVCLFGFINLKLRHVDNLQFATKIIKKSFKLTNKILVIDMLSSKVNKNYKKENFVNYYSPIDVINIASKISSNFKLIHNLKSIPQREMLLILEKNENN